MADIVVSFNPATSDLTRVSVPQSARSGGIVFWNESNISLNISFQDGTTMYLPGWYHRHKCGYAGDITWTLRTTLNSPNPPTSEIIVEMYVHGEHFPTDGPIVRQTNGSAEASVTSTNAIVNTGNPPLTSIISAQPADAASSTWAADTSGNLTIKSDNVGTLTTLIQLIAGASPAVKLAAAAVLTECLGNLQVDGNATFTGTSTHTGTATFNGQVTLGSANGIIGGSNTLIGKTSAGDILDAGTTADTYLKSVNNINFQNNGTTQVTVSSNGLRSVNGAYYGTDLSNTIIQSTGSTGTGNTRVQNTDHISLQVPGGSEQLGISSTGCTFAHSINLVNGSLGQLKNFSGTGNGTIATGITNPTAICFNPCTQSGSSQTIGGTTSSSSVITTGAGLAWSATAWHN